MNIRGTEGLSPADLQAEIARGARFVAYQWCISLLVVTLKRGTRIYYLKPSDTGFVPGFLWSAFTLVAGWWGFPWGPIYTIGALWTNARGGIDVTAAVSVDLANAHGAAASPPLVEAPTTGPRWSAGPLAAIGVFAFAIFAVIAGTQQYASQHRPVALVNGLDASYSATIDGVSHALRPHSVSELELAEGPHTVVAALPGGVGEIRFTFSSGDNATVVNPDTAALVAEETSYYGTASNPTDKNPDPTIHCGKESYNLRTPDFFLQEFPTSVSMSKYETRTSRSRLAVYSDIPIDQVAKIVLHRCGRPAMVAYLRSLGEHLPNNQIVLGTAAQTLEPAEAKVFFDRHLATRPVLVEWHRAYQNLQRSLKQDTELATEYRQLAEANPDDGAFAYLYGRLLDNAVENSTWFERALAAKRPCAYAHFALAYNAAARGDFADALAGLDRASNAGLDNDTTQAQRIECLLALGRPAEALQELRKKPAARTDFSRANEEIHLAYIVGGKPAARQVIDTFLARLPAEARKESGSEIRKSLDAHLAYYEGDTKTYATSIPADATGFAAVTRALCLHDPNTAVRATAASPDSEKSLAYFLLYLSLGAAKDSDAEAFWKMAWGLSDKRHARLAAHFAGTARLTDAELLDFPMSPAEKRIFLTAIGLHEPNLRAAAFARAQQCDFSRDFPHHLVAAALASAKL